MHILAYRTCLGLTITIVLCGIANSQNSPQPTQQSASNNSTFFHFQRLLVPADRPEDWPRDPKVHYLPMTVGEFDERIRQLRDGLASPVLPTTAQLVQASYVAELHDDNILRGRLEWKLENHGAATGLVLLGDSRFSLSDFDWTNDQTSAHTISEQSTINAKGTVVGNDATGRLIAIVDHSGVLKADWSLSGQKHNDTLVFNLQLPNCTVNRLQLTLPNEFTASIPDAGISAVVNLNAKQRQWTFELGRADHALLHIDKRAISSESASKSFTSEHYHYSFTDHGLELDAEFRVAVIDPPLHRIQLALDKRLIIVNAQIENTKLHVAELSPPGKNQDERILELNVPPALTGSNLVLQVHATAPFSNEALFRLPFIHVANSDWQSGEAQLLVPESLVISDLTTKSCRQTTTTASTAIGTVIALQLFNAQPLVDLKLSQPTEQLRLRQGSTVLLRPNEGTGRCFGEFAINHGARFVLDAQIAPDWIIEDVDSVPAGNVADWSQRLARGIPGNLHILLNSPLTPQTGLRLTIAGRRRSAPWGKALRCDDLAMLQFSDATSQRQIIDVQTTENYRLQLQGADELNRLDSEHISPDDAVLLEEKPAGLVFAADENAQSLAISLANKAPQYEANIQSQAIVDDDRLTESYHFSITPKSREVSRLTVRLSQLRSTPIAWSIEGEPGAAVTARRLTESEGSVVSWPGDVWEILLANPRTAPFVLHASRNTPLSDDMPLSLASLLDAETQQGTIQISCVAATLPEIHSRRLKSIPVDPAQSEQSGADLAAFRYAPEEDTLLTTEPPLVIAPRAAGADLARAWIWQAQLSCRYSRNGIESTLICHIENTGQDQLLFQAPAEAELQSIVIDGQRINKLDSNSSDWRVSLPNGKRFATVALIWNDRLHPIDGVMSACSAPWPEVNVPILSRQWAVKLSPGMTVADLQIGNSHLFDASWTKRIFGPLAAGSPPVENFRASHESLMPGTQVNGIDTPLPNTNSTTKQTNPFTLQSPWNGSLNQQSSDDSNWSSYCFDGAGATDQIWIANTQLLVSWAWSLFLFTFASRWWFGNRNLSVEIALLGCATVGTLLIPASWAPLGAAVWLGLAAGKLVAWASSYILPTDAATARPVAPAVLSQKTVATISLIALLAALTSQGFATEANDETGTSQSTIERADTKIFIPTDQDGHSTGGLCYVPEAFHDELLRATGGNDAAPQYVIISASYGPLTSKSTNDPAYGDWQAKYVIQSLVDHAQVKLPLGFDGAVLVPDAIKVDGQPAQFGSDNQSRSTLVTIEHPGSHRIDVVLHPAINSKGFSFVIPHVTNSQLDLHGVDTHRYHIEIEPDNKTPVDLLPPTNVTESRSQTLTDRIVLRLAEANYPEETLPRFDINELYWLRIRHNSVAANARFHLNIQSGSVRQLHLHIDSRWQPILEPETPMDSEVIAVSQIHAATEENNDWVINLARPATGKATVDIAFRLNSDTGIGCWRPFQCKVAGARTEKSWWGATVDKGLQYSLSPAQNGHTIPVENFAALWPSQNELPQIAWQPAASDKTTSISTWPVEPKLSAKYSLAAIAGLKELDVRLAAQVNITDGPIFQLRVHVPPSLQIDRVVTNSKDVAQPLRWSHSNPDVVTLFFDSPITSQCNLFLRGRLPISLETKVSLPQLSVDGSTADGFRGLIFRQPEVLISSLGAEGLQQSSESDPTAISEAEHKSLLESRSEKITSNRPLLQPQLVYVLNGKDVESATFKIDPNRPQIRTVQVATLTRSADAWLTTLNVDFQIDLGVVDSLRFDLPANWTGPFEISPSLSYSVEEIVGEKRQQLVIRPENPIQDKYSLKISGPLTITSGERASAPDVRFVGAARQSRFFLLPRRLENQQLAWETRGLIPRPLPESVATAAPDPTSYRAYQLVGDRCRAELRSIEPSTENAQVRLMDVEWSWDASGNHRGVAAFDLEPGAATNCELQLPANSRLVQAELDSTPAQLSPRGENRWGVWLGDNKMPHYLQIIFQGNGLQESPLPIIMPAPTLVDLPVERQLWAVRSPNTVGADRKPAATAISPLRHDLVRLESAASAVKSVSGLLLDESASDISRWYTTWLRQFIACRAELIAAKTANVTEDVALNADAELNAIDQEQAKLARKIDATKKDSDMSSNTSVAFDWLHLAPLASTKNSAVFGVTKGNGQVALLYDRTAYANPNSRYFAAVAVGFLTLAMLLALRLMNSHQEQTALNS
jgi:hypothetical protein